MSAISHFHREKAGVLIYKIEIENFGSIKDRQIIDLDVPASLSDPDGRLVEIFPGADRKAPKVVAVFGANASGKTTLLKALDVLTRFPRYYPLKVNEQFFFDAFQDEASFAKPISLALEFGGPVELDGIASDDGDSTGLLASPESCVYRYELVFESFHGNQYIVGQENLYQRPVGAPRWRRLFERQNGKVKGPTDGKIFPLSGYSAIIDKLPTHASLIATLAEFQHRPSTILVEASSRVSRRIGSDSPDRVADVLVGYLGSNPEVLSSLNTELRKIDVGLESVRIEQTGSGPIALFKHDGLTKELRWPLESHGTRSFLAIYPLLANALSDGGVVIIDEIDAQLHPILLTHIVEWFQGRGDRNPHNAQLWFTSHSASLLSDLTKEEILICEKDAAGKTEIFGLRQVAGVKRDENFYAKYLGGIYGGVPQIG